MRLFYLANIRFPTERAHGIQVGKMCEAFARAGAKVTLLVPDRKTLQDDPFSYYGLEKNFTIEKIPVPDIVSWGRVGFFIESLLFAYGVAKRARTENAVVYSREELPFRFLKGVTAFYEAHQFRRGFLSDLKRAKGIVSISQGLKDALVAAGLPAEKILVAHDAVDEKAFSVTVDKKEMRARLGLPEEGKIAMYIGGFEEWKGIQTLCEAAPMLEKKGIIVVVIGGTAEEKESFERKYPSVRFLGPRPYSELPFNQQAADVLVVPNSSKIELGSKFTSPLKLFAHMASGVALAIADVPALNEIVEPTQVFKFTPDDPSSLANTVSRALSSEWLSEWVSKSAQAKLKSADFTWSKRADAILRFIETGHA